MKKIRDNINTDVLSILKTRFNVNTNRTIKNISSILDKNKKTDEKSINQKYLEYLPLDFKGIGKAISEIISDCNPHYSKIDKKTMIEIIIESIRYKEIDKKKYITLSEFSKRHKLSINSIKNAIYKKNYMMKKFKHNPQITTITKEIVKIVQYKHYKNKKIDIMFYWKESFLNKIMKENKIDENKTSTKIFKYRMPKDIHYAFKSIYYILELISDFNPVYKGKYNIEDKKIKLDLYGFRSMNHWQYMLIETNVYYWLCKHDTNDYKINLNKSLKYKNVYYGITSLEIIEKNANISAYRKLHYRILQNTKYHHNEELSNNLIRHYSSHHTYETSYYIYLNGINSLICEAEEICYLISCLFENDETLKSATKTIIKYFQYIIENYNKHNCDTCRKWFNFNNMHNKKVLRYAANNLRYSYTYNDLNIQKKLTFESVLNNTVNKMYDFPFSFLMSGKKLDILDFDFEIIE